MSKYEVFSGLYFLVFEPEKTPYLNTFHAVIEYKKSLVEELLCTFIFTTFLFSSVLYCLVISYVDTSILNFNDGCVALLNFSPCEANSKFNIANLRRNTPYMKLYQTSSFTRKGFHCSFSPMNFEKYFKTAFFQNESRQRLLHTESHNRKINQKVKA